jgi:hypothetical protein
VDAGVGASTLAQIEGFDMREIAAWLLEPLHIFLLVHETEEAA